MLFNYQVMAQNSYVWLHGLNDNSNCWNVYNNAFTPGVGTLLGYSSHNSIVGIASNHFNSITSQPNTIIIGHSMGGLVAREVESGRHPNIRGIITIGTPHQGAFVQNSIAAGKQKEFISSTTNKLSNGIAISSVAFIGPFSLVKIAALALGNGIVSELCDGLLKPFIGSLMADGSQQCEKDMQVGSQYMNAIESRRVNVPILTFAAEEDRWAVSRLAWCGYKKSVLQTDANANSDGKIDIPGYNITKGAQVVSYSISGIHASCAVAAIALGWWKPYSWYAAGLNVAAGTYWLTVGNYITSGLDYDYSVVLGSYAYEKRTYCYETITCGEMELMQKYIQPDDCYTESVCQTYTVAVPCSHDGVVSTYTQQLDRSKGNTVIWGTSTIKGVNHMEEFNHYKTKDEFDKAIKQGFYGYYFKK